MKPTPEEERAWLDGYRAAAEVAKSVRVRIDGAEVDEAIELGVRIVASTLQRQLSQFEEEQK